MYHNLTEIPQSEEICHIYFWDQKTLVVIAGGWVEDGGYKRVWGCVLSGPVSSEGIKRSLQVNFFYLTISPSTVLLRICAKNFHHMFFDSFC